MVSTFGIEPEQQGPGHSRVPGVDGAPTDRCAHHPILVRVGAYTQAVADDAHRADVPDFWAVVPAGGPGTRLWPLSRRARPKFLLDVTGRGSSLLSDTVTRLSPLCDDRLLVVTGTQHAAAVREALPHLDEGQVLTEPSPKDSLPAIGLAAARLERQYPAAVLGSFAADHLIGDQDLFRAAVVRAVGLARDGMLATLGITPSRPATGFGYIRPGPTYPRPVEGSPTARRALAFVEKPDDALATQYVRDGYLWNAGIFVVQAGVLMGMIERWQPQLAAVLRSVTAQPEGLDALWDELPPVSIDRGVAEPAARAGHVGVVEASFGWDDIGDFAAVAAHLPPSSHDPEVRVGGQESLVLAHESTGLVIAAGGRPVVALGVPDIVVVDTPDAVLVTTRERVQDVKAVMAQLTERGHRDVT